MLEGGAAGLQKCWAIWNTWKLKWFLIVPLAITKPDGLDATFLLGMNRALPRLEVLGWGQSPSAWLLLTSSPARCTNHSTCWDGPLIDIRRQFLCSSSILTAWHLLTLLHEVVRHFSDEANSVGKQAYSPLFELTLINSWAVWWKDWFTGVWEKGAACNESCCVGQWLGSQWFWGGGFQFPTIFFSKYTVLCCFQYLVKSFTAATKLLNHESRCHVAGQ